VGALGGVLAWLQHFRPLTIATFALVAFTCAVVVVERFIALRVRRRPLKETMEFDYAYGLALEGLPLGRDDGKPDAAFQVNLLLRNATNAPLRYYVESMSVVIGDRTPANAVFTNRGGVIPWGGTTEFSYPAFSKAALDSFGPRNDGRVEYTIRYGHPEGGYVRVCRKVLDVSYVFPERGGSCRYGILSETDESLRGGGGTD
jgi:hypothetical protein